MKKKTIYIHVAGNTLNSHKKFIEELTKKGGVKYVETPAESDATVLFCPIVSRYETDIQSALSTASGCRNIIVVAMHHTFDKDYTVPNRRGLDNPEVILVVNCLFFESKGLLKCPLNKKAVKLVRMELDLSKGSSWCCWKPSGRKRGKERERKAKFKKNKQQTNYKKSKK